MPDDFLTQLDRINKRGKKPSVRQPAPLPGALHPLSIAAPGLDVQPIKKPVHYGPDPGGDVASLLGLKPRKVQTSARPAAPADYDQTIQDLVFGPAASQHLQGLPRASKPVHLAGRGSAQQTPEEHHRDQEFMETSNPSQHEANLRAKKAELETAVRQAAGKGLDPTSLYKRLQPIYTELRQLDKTHKFAPTYHEAMTRQAAKPGFEIQGQYPEEQKADRAELEAGEPRTTFNQHAPDLAMTRNAGSMLGMIAGMLTDRLGTTIHGAPEGWFMNDPEMQGTRQGQDMAVNLASMFLPGGIGKLAQAAQGSDIAGATAVRAGQVGAPRAIGETAANMARSMNPLEPDISTPELMSRLANLAAMAHGHGAEGETPHDVVQPEAPAAEEYNPFRPPAKGERIRNNKAPIMPESLARGGKSAAEAGLDPEGVAHNEQQLHRVFTDALGHKFSEERMSPQDIGVYPNLQYKKAGVHDRENMVSDELKGVSKYDQATGGPLTVWETKDGKRYVINGHHRRELAIRTGEPDVPVRIYREADGIDFNRARALGALQNLRDGKGTAIDAATVLRDLKADPKQLGAWGLNTRGGVARDAMSLLRLEPQALQMVEEGRVPESVASGIADNQLPPDKQIAALRDAERAGLSTRKEGENLGAMVKDRKVIQRQDSQGNIFGEIDESTALAEQAKISALVERRLASDQRLYNAITRGKVAGETSIDTHAQDEAARVQDFARQVIGKDAETAETLERAAQEYARNPVKSKLDAAVTAVTDAARRGAERRLHELGALRRPKPGGLEPDTRGGSSSGAAGRPDGRQGGAESTAGSGGRPTGEPNGTGAADQSGTGQAGAANGSGQHGGAAPGPEASGRRPGRELGDDQGAVSGAAEQPQQEEVDGRQAPDYDSQNGLFATVGQAPRAVGVPGKQRTQQPKNPPLTSQHPAPTPLSQREGKVFQAYDAIVRNISPQSRSEEAGIAADLLREKGGTEAQRVAQMRNQGRDLWRKLANMPVDERFRVAAETEQSTSAPHSVRSQLGQEIQEYTRHFLDPTRDAIRQETGRLQEFDEDYFPHLFADASAAKSAFANLFSRRPLQGAKGFLKRRSHEGTIWEVLQDNPHLKPRFDNPIDMLVAAEAQQQKFLQAHRMMAKLPASGVEVRYVRAGAKAPANFEQIPDALFTNYGSGDVTIHEAYDEGMRRSIEGLITNLGGTHERTTNLGQAQAWGHVQGDNVRTRFGGDTAFMSHELGHLIDNKFGLQRDLFYGPDAGKMRNEAHTLAGFRYAGQPSNPKFENYVHGDAEMVANVVHAYIHAPDLFRKEAPALLGRFEKFIDAHPELGPIRDIHGGLAMAQNSTTLHNPGIHTLGHYYVPSEVAQVFKNYLGPGLRGNGLYDMVAGVNNGLNQVQLALPFFHGVGTLINAGATETSIGLKHVVRGAAKLNPKEVVGGVGRVVMGTVPGLKTVTAARYIAEGHRVQQQYLGLIDDPKMRAIVEGVMHAGGRAQMDAAYATHWMDRMGEAWRGKRVVGIIGNAAGSALEGAAFPVMQLQVPKIKLGAFGRIFADKLNIATDGGRRMLTDNEKRRIAAEAWDSVDNRFGQVVYDNMFTNRVTMDLAHAATRSVGWNVGTWRELGGGAKDLIKKRELTDRAAFWPGLIMTVGASGAMLNYLLTGQAPQSIRDCLVPRTGKKNPDGTDERVNFPSYVKDIYGFRHSPIDTVTSKIGPAWEMLAQILQNHDFYNTEIRHEDDPIAQQGKDILTHVLNEMLPFSIQNQAKEVRQSGSPNALALLGMNKAPTYLEKSPAMQLADKFTGQNMPSGSRTKEQTDKSNQMKALVGLARNKQPMPAGTDKDMADDAKDRASENHLVSSVRRLHVDQAVAVYEKATRFERQQLRGMVQDKIDNASDKWTADQITRLQQRLVAADRG